MAVCKHRPEAGGLLIPCSYGGRKTCLCGDEYREQLQAEEARAAEEAALAAIIPVGPDPAVSIWQRIFRRTA